MLYVQSFFYRKLIVIFSLQQMNYPQDQEDTYYKMLQYLKKLLKRENLCHNTYLFKKMQSDLTLPLNVIVEENTVASISGNYDLIMDALVDTGLARVVNGKQVKIIEHATMKINLNDHLFIRQIENILEQKEVKFQISKRYDQNQYINFTIFSQNSQWLEALIKKINPHADFKHASLLEDIKFGVDRIRKLKFEHAKKKTTIGKVRYSLTSPPEVFIRKALQSSDQEQELLEIGSIKNKINGKANGNSHPQKRHKNKAGNKPRVQQNDFPTLTTSN